MDFLLIFHPSKHWGILVIDKDIDSCDLMTLLQPYGVEVQEAFLVQQALPIFMQWQPDVLVSEMPCLRKMVMP
jgi:hypothetical protein